MKTYKKRIAFCLSDQHTIPHGGLGQFAKSFIENFVPLGYKVDIISDKPTSNAEFKEYLESQGASFVYPSEVRPYSSHTKTFMFEDSYNFEKMSNFRDAMMKALNTNLYDIIICNTLESFPGIYALNIHKSIQVIYYTHNESMVFLDDRTWKNEFTESFNELFNALMKVKGITIGTQTLRNNNELRAQGITNSYELPIPMTEKTLLEEHNKPREGVLWIGRWEPRKNPEEFIRVIKETGLPAKVITNTNGAKKFEEALKAIGAKYEIKIGVYGKEKVDFITSARVAYNPAIRESFGLAFYECMGQLPTVAIKGMSWLDNFSNQWYFCEDKKNIPKLILKLYEDFADSRVWYSKSPLNNIVSEHADGIQAWIDIFESFKPVESNSVRATINEYSEIEYAEFIKILNRKDLSIDDVKSVLTNKYKYNIIYTDTSTYLSKDPNFVPKEKEINNLESLFG
jgi:glycosyltransferase involved in cell wall biosynthesis